MPPSPVVAVREQRCMVCGGRFTSRRRDAETCSARCRKRRERRMTTVQDVDTPGSSPPGDVTLPAETEPLLSHALGSMSRFRDRMRGHTSEPGKTSPDAPVAPKPAPEPSRCACAFLLQGAGKGPPLVSARAAPSDELGIGLV